MTQEAGFCRKKRPKHLPPWKTAAPALCGIFCLLLLFRNSRVAMDAIQRGLEICAKTVIPSLFPFMILSEILIKSNAASLIPKPLLCPLMRLWNLPAAGCFCALMGMACGFPVGAKCAASAYERGEITKEEAADLLAFSATPSPAFLMGTVGIALWNSARFGTALLVTILLLAITEGAVLGRKRKKRAPSPDFREHFSIQPSLPLFRILTDSIPTAIAGILSVCAYVIFFSALMGALEAASGQIAMPAFLRGFLFTLPELTGGVTAAARLPTAQAIPITAFGAGWAGLSVHCQIFSVSESLSFSYGTYFLRRLLFAIACALAFAAACYFFPSLMG